MERIVSARRRVTIASDLAAAVTAVGLGIRPSRASASASPPTIVLINLDDLDFRSIAHMPQTLALIGDAGMTFANCLVSQPGCSPSRATLLRGQYPHNHGVLRSSGSYGGFQRFHHLGLEESSLGTWMHDAGYRTALIGKYFNEYPMSAPPAYIPPGWDYFLSPVFTEGRLGGVNYIDYAINDNGTVIQRGHAPEDYATDVMADAAAAQIADAATAGTPLFLYLAPRAPHQPAKPAPRHEGTLAGTTAPRGAAFNEEDVSDKPLWLQATTPFSDADIAEIDAQYQRRRETLLAADDLVATVIGALEATGQLDNAWIFFTSDNGYYVGEHRQFDEKGSPYEEAIRVPLLVRGPGVAAGSMEERLVGNVDLAPTIAAIAGATTPDFVDGRSILPLLLREPEVPWRDALLVQQRDPKPGDSGNVAGDGNGPQHPAWTGLRREDTVYVEYSDGELEFYDLSTDPEQLQNLASDLVIADRVVLSARLDDLRRCAGEQCRAADLPRSSDAQYPPLPVILRPEGLDAIDVGTMLEMSGVAYDSDGNELPGDALSWHVDITWDDQRVELLPETPGPTATTELPRRPPGKERGRANYLVEVHLRAALPTGLSREAVVVVQARPNKG